MLRAIVFVLCLDLAYIAGIGVALRYDHPMRADRIGIARTAGLRHSTLSRQMPFAGTHQVASAHLPGSLHLRGGSGPVGEMLTVNLPQLDERRKKRRALPKSAPTFEEKGDDKKGDNGPTFDEEETDRYDRMLREAAEEDDDFSGDAEEMAKVTYETWAARVNAKTERDAVGQRHEDTDFGVGVLDGRYTEAPPCPPCLVKARSCPL